MSDIKQVRNEILANKVSAFSILSLSICFPYYYFSINCTMFARVSFTGYIRIINYHVDFNFAGNKSLKQQVILPLFIRPHSLASASEINSIGRYVRTYTVRQTNITHHHNNFTVLLKPRICITLVLYLHFNIRVL